MMSNFYTLDKNKNVVKTSFEDFMLSGGMGSSDKRRVVETFVDDNIKVSTVFLAINHNYIYLDPPLIFETMIFGGERNEDCYR
ncbi:hypothetical protein LCGC14_1676840, partial [marine sediment metagenome]